MTNYTGNIELLVKPLLYYSILYDEIYIKSINQSFGQGGSLFSSLLLFGKCIFFDSIDETYFYKNTNLYNSGHRFLKIITNVKLFNNNFKIK